MATNPTNITGQAARVNDTNRLTGKNRPNQIIVPTEVNIEGRGPVRNPNEIAAEVTARLQAEKAERLGAAQEGAQKLSALREGLEALHDDFGATFDDGPNDDERSVWVQQHGRLIAKWTRRGRSLIFQPEMPRQLPREVADVEQAIAITVEFLLKRRSMAKASTS